MRESCAPRPLHRRRAIHLVGKVPPLHPASSVCSVALLFVLCTAYGTSTVSRKKLDDGDGGFVIPLCVRR